MNDDDQQDELLRDVFSRRRTAMAGGKCPGDDLIWDAVAGQLSSAEAQKLLDHSLDCDLCKQSWLAAAALGSERGRLGTRAADEAAPVAGPAQAVQYHGTSPSNRQRGQLRLLVAMAATLLLAVLVTFYLGPDEPTGMAGPLSARVQTSLWKVGRDAPLSDGDSLQVGDRIYLQVASNEPLYLYVINRDRTGDPAVLFPVPGSQWSNPLPATDGSLRLPGSAGGAYDSWEVTSAGERESFTLVASRDPLDEMEDVIAHLDQARPADSMTRGPEVEAADRAREMAWQALVDALRRVEQAGTENTFVREIVLENTGKPD